MAKKLNHEVAYRGEKNLAHLKSKQIVLCGVGALGSNLADTLLRQGVENLRVIDMDRVETHNVSTQLYGDADVGAMKVAALKNRLFKDTGVEIEAIDKELNDGSKKKLLKGADLVIDTFDNSKSRRLVHEYCFEQKLPCLHAGMFEGYGEVVWDKVYTVPQDPPKDAVVVCDYPLARNLITFVVSLLAEETMDFCIMPKPRLGSWSITLADLKIQKYR